MTKDNKTHWRRHDYRVRSLDMIIEGLIKAIAVLEDDVKKIHWYDGDWFLEESEPIFGLAFVAFQNYINGSIIDFSEDANDKISYYKIGNKLENFVNTDIELIIALANYSKHHDEGLPKKGTLKILQNFKLNYEGTFYLDELAIFQGLTILSPSWDISEIKNRVTEWRELLWT